MRVDGNLVAATDIAWREFGVVWIVAVNGFPWWGRGRIEDVERFGKPSERHFRDRIEKSSKKFTRPRSSCRAASQQALEHVLREQLFLTDGVDRRDERVDQHRDARAERQRLRDAAPFRDSARRRRNARA
jgi:hypothetical protein